MKTFSIFKSGLLILAASLVLLFPLNMMAQEEIEIQVSPNVLNLENKGQVVTVHTDIAFSLVVGSSVMMNGVEINHWKADNQGNFVAKFLMEEICGLDLDIGEYNTLTLEGTKTDGTTFIGTDEIMVIQVLPKGKN